MIVDLENLAMSIIFGHVKSNEDLQEKIKGQWELRKGKTIADVNKAVKNGMDKGMDKTEYEIDMVSVYLKDVFKKVKPTKI